MEGMRGTTRMMTMTRAGVHHLDSLHYDFLELVYLSKFRSESLARASIFRCFASAKSSQEVYKILCNLTTRPLT